MDGFHLLLRHFYQNITIVQFRQHCKGALESDTIACLVLSSHDVLPVDKATPSFDKMSIFTARRIPSVRLSVTRRYCVKTTARSTVQFALADSKMCLVL